jgi:hypothetical protein
MPDVRTAPIPGGSAPPGGPRPGRVASDRAGTVRREVADLLLPWVLGVATLVARLATAAAGPTDWDSSQYAAAVGRFDVAHGRPQPPGYVLYVLAGRALHGVGFATVDALVLVSALASALAVGLVVVAGRDLGGRWVGVAAGLVVATSPFAWFNGSVVATYSFDLVAAPLLIILAWRARPHSWHGAAALASLGLVAGFRQSALQAFALLAVLAVAGSVRRVREAAVAGTAFVCALAAWLVPTALLQPGGAAAWMRATRIETLGAFRVTSVLDHAPDGTTNLGTFAAYTTVALLPVAALALVAALLLGIRALVRTVHRHPYGQGGLATVDLSDNRAHSPGARATEGADAAAPSTVRTDPGVLSVDGAADPGGWSRPWYQSRTAILVAAVVPPAALVALVEFAKGGYVLAELPGAVIALLLVPAALLRPRRPAGDGDAGATPRRRAADADAPDPGRRGRTGARIWLAVATVAVAAIAVAGTQRFLGATGVLPVAVSTPGHGPWLTQARYQAPYLDTRSAIRSADAIDRALARVGPLVDPGRDVVVLDTVDGGGLFYRNAGWALPRHRVALVAPGVAVYNEQSGSLYYTSAATIPVGVGGSVYLLAPPNLPGLAKLAGDVQAFRVPGAPPVADYRLWRIAPGADILGVAVVVRPGPRPLGSPIVG